ncbi:hypothetical protein SmJEL517_g02830 [Synchytrium microbalum]|uniref:UNC-45/Cro1/She4 central domain-containing protein n=1 Tax=Synchytrium microbalum TaxID=1806994 RepID=A0A507C976_9FUNG|nr:uncharacterized protein SmJEL517_g02830 [Synchytrium microbalum]TPX34546.1 hypothetical protein SmJEL517_g02830 [Synchytrium microbalum]
MAMARIDVVLETSSLSEKPEILLKRAKIYETIGDYQHAFDDVRLVLSLDKTNTDALKTAQQLVRLTAEKQSSSPVGTISSMLLLISGGSGDDQTEDSARSHGQNREVIERLISASQDPSGAATIGREGGVELLMPVTVSNKTPSSTHQAQILQILVNLTQLPELASRILSYIDSSTVTTWMNSNDSPTIQHAADLLGNSVLQSLSTLKDQPKLRDSAVTAVRALAKLAVEFSKDEPSRVAGVKGLITAIGDEDSAVMFMNSNEFVDLLACVSDRKISIRQLIPVALARFLDTTSAKREDELQALLHRLISKWVESDVKGDKARGLLALSAVFQAKSSIGSSILLKQGFVEDLMEVIEFEGEDVQLAVVETLSSSCADKACRTLVAARCAAFLLTLGGHQNAQLRTVASVALIKCMSADKELEKQMLQQADRSVMAFANVIQNKQVDETLKLNAVEALAFLSTHGVVKDLIITNSSLLKSMFNMASATDKKAVQFGIASTLMNITVFRRKFTDEEKQILKLRAMAEQTGEPIVDPLDEDTAVERRCVALAKEGAVSALVALANGSSPALREMVAQTFLSMARDKSLRGIIVQQGGVKSLITLTGEGTSESIAHAAQALAKVAITSDPHVSFPGQRAAELVRPLVSLCGSESELCQFEALMALTNLASIDDDIRGRIVAAKGVAAMENLQFSDNIMVRRAATEALCNMVFEPSVYTAYAVASASSKLRMFIALSDSEDFETRRAASGALAILSQHPTACKNISIEGRGPEIVVTTIGESCEVEVQLRGVELVKNMASCGNRDVVSSIVEKGAIDKVKKLLASPNQAVSRGAAGALKAFRDAGVSLV